MKIRVDINEIENKNNRKKPKKQVCFFGKINEYDKCLLQLMRKKLNKTKLPISSMRKRTS